MQPTLQPQPGTARVPCCGEGAGIGHVIGLTTSGAADELRAAGAHTSAREPVALAALVDRLREPGRRYETDASCR